MGSVIETSRDGRVLAIELTRPHQLNALNSEVLRLLVETDRDACRAIRPVGCVVITGAGDRAFSAGADLDEIRGLGVVEAQEFIRRGHRTMTAIADSPVPVIAAVDGFALGGGFELMLACHLASPRSAASSGCPRRGSAASPASAAPSG